MIILLGYDQRKKVRPTKHIAYSNHSPLIYFLKGDTSGGKKGGKKKGGSFQTVSAVFRVCEFPFK